MEDTEKIREHSSFKRARNKAEAYKDEPEKVNQLISDATAKAGDRMPKSFDEIKENVFSLFRMVKAYTMREYTDVPWKSIALIITTILYFISPIDMIPDFIPVFGYLDDVALLTWTLKTLKADIDAFCDWERADEQST